MLEKQINGFIEYCKVSGFRDKSIESLSIRLNQFNNFLKTARLRKIKSITYRYLSRFVADYKNPSIHVKKARIWSLRQFFHYLKLNGYVNENIATDLPYPKIEKTVPHFLTIREYNLILHHCLKNASTFIGLRNLIIIIISLRDVACGTACGTFLDMLITYFSIVLICFLLQLFHRGLRIGLL